MARLQEAFRIGEWAVKRDDWGDKQGRVDYSFFLPGVTPHKRSVDSVVQIYAEWNVVNGVLDLRFPTQLSLVLGVLASGQASEEELQKTKAEGTKMFGFDNGVYILNGSDKATVFTDDPDSIEFKAADLPGEDEELRPETLALRLRDRYPEQRLADSHVTFATESSVLNYFPSGFAGEQVAKVYLYTPAELTEAALLFLHHATSLPGHDLPWDYIDKVAVRKPT